LPSQESRRETIEKIQKVSRARTCGGQRLRELVKRKFVFFVRKVSRRSV
jgi:hypothetical protein